MSDLQEKQQRKLNEIRTAQQDRQSYIDYRLYFLGEIGRPDLERRFGIAPAGATRDISFYRSIAPNNIAFDKSEKLYRVTPEFKPVFQHDTTRVLTSLAQGFGDGINAQHDVGIPCEYPQMLNVPKIEVIAPISRAIFAKRAISIEYQSKSGRSERIIVPFALVDTGNRWHTRAYDRKSGEFRDFVLTRIENPKEIEAAEAQPQECSDRDIQWTRIVELTLVPHPHEQNSEFVELDYGMKNGELQLQTRAATAGYLLRRWGVDCTDKHKLDCNQFPLWLKDNMVLYGVSSALLAPGYEPKNK